MSARPGLCGGHQVTGVPTAINSYVEARRPCLLSACARRNMHVHRLASRLRSIAEGQLFGQRLWHDSQNWIGAILCVGPLRLSRGL